MKRLSILLGMPLLLLLVFFTNPTSAQDCGDCAITELRLSGIYDYNCGYTYSYQIESNCPVVSAVWTFSDGTVEYGNNIYHRYPGPGNHWVSVTVTTSDGTNTCSRTETTSANPPACTDGCEVCGNLHNTSLGAVYDTECGYTFDFTTPPTDCEFVSAEWNFSDGLTVNAPTVYRQFPGPGFYTYTLDIVYALGQDTCEESFSDFIEIPEYCDNTPCTECSVSGLSLSAVYDYNCGFTFDYDLPSSNCQVIDATWAFSDGNIVNGSPAYNSFPNAGSHAGFLTLTLTNGTDTCTILRMLEVDAIACDPEEKCDNECAIEPGTMHVFNAGSDPCRWVVGVSGSSSACPVIGMDYNFGDGTAYYSSGSFPQVHYYAQSGTYEVCVTEYRASNGDTCSYEYCQTIEVQGCNELECEGTCFFNPTKGEAKTATPSSNPCEILAWVGGASSNCDVVDREVNWGDGTVDANAPFFSSHIYQNPGTYQICITLTVSDGQDICQRQFCTSVTVEGCGEEGNRSRKTGDFASGTFTVSPNPAANGATWKINLGMENQVHSITLRNLQGQLLGEWPTNGLSKIQIPVSETLPQGIYLLQTDNPQLGTKKLIVR